MEINEAKALIKKHTAGHTAFIGRANTANRYYRNENDILYAKQSKEPEENPLRNADNRIPRNFHGLLVNQKASYLFTAPPTFDVGNAQANKRIAEVLGDRFPKVCKDICINASNAGVAWLHYWADNTGFKYAAVDAAEVIPIWSDDLEKKLIATLRVYQKVDDTGKGYVVYEIWTDTECSSFQKEMDVGVDVGLMECMMFPVFLDNQQINTGNTLKHGYGAVPFVPFFNNNLRCSDLDNIKPLIDTYDKVFSGFVNDLEDIQEVIFVLSGYGGTDKATFVNELKKYKMIDLQNDGPDDKSGLTTLTIEIPVEAREKLLELTRKAIFEQGQGVDPQPEAFGNASGVALKYLYSLLELKAGLMETEFRLGFGSFVRALCLHLGIACKQIVQTWTRTAIANDLELADIAAKSTGVISRQTILKNHPWVDDHELEEQQIKREEEETTNPYKEPLTKGGEVSDEA